MTTHLSVQTVIGLIAVLYMIYRAHSRKSLTPDGIIAAAIVGTIHAIHPFRLLVLLLVFFLCGTKLTHWGSDIKSELLTDDHDHKEESTIIQDSSTVQVCTASKKTGPVHDKKGRTAVQVLCNSLPATVLALTHLLLYCTTEAPPHALSFSHDPSDLLIFGVIAQYACSAADTFSSEIGILNDGWPILITTFRKVPPGTNGGVSLLGLIAALMGGSMIGLSSCLAIPTSGWRTKVCVVVVGTTAGSFGSLIDSVLGATLQRTIYDTQMKKVIEVHGGSAVKKSAKHAQGDTYIVLGYDVLDNNQVNLVSALITVVVTMAVVGMTSYSWQLIASS